MLYAALTSLAQARKHGSKQGGEIAHGPGYT